MPRQPNPQPQATKTPHVRSGTVTRRRYDHYCGAARALDAVGDRWSLLIVRELLAGPRRYTDLHADLPGVSTDVLASRLKDLEQSGLATRRRLPPPASASVYDLTDRGRGLLPVLTALAVWGSPDLAERRPTDAVRAHWFALPLRERLAGAGAGVAEVDLGEGVFHVHVGELPPGADGAGSGAGAQVYGEGPAPGTPDARLKLTAATCTALVGGGLTVPDAVAEGLLAVEGDGALAKALRGDG